VVGEGRSREASPYPDLWPIATNFSLAPDVSFWGEAEVGRAAEFAASVETDPTATSTDTIRGWGEHEAAGVSSDTWLGDAAYMGTPTTIIGQARIAALTIRRTY
jgi:hypothetical protein